MKNLKIPRKLKKEIVKVESIVKQPYWVNPQSFGVQLKSGVKVNKWTVKLINKIIAEQKIIVRKVYSSNLENMKAQIDYENIRRRMGIMNHPTMNEIPHWFLKVKVPKNFDIENKHLPHRLHNHPKTEVLQGLSENEVIVDREFVNLFSKIVPVDNNMKHFIVSKQEYLNQIREKRYKMGFDPAYGKDYSVEAGYVIKDSEIDKNGVRVITDFELKEVSITKK